MLNFHLTGTFPQGYALALPELLPILNVSIAESGLPVTVQRGNALCVQGDGTGYRITWVTPVSFYRALALLCTEHTNGAVQIVETPCFDSCGVMLDCSRNAVLTVDAVKNILRRMALMGLNLAMMYTEDTYEIPTRPYFGYLRGRYTQAELKALDDYANVFGIEMVPCIQTLAHLERALQWPCMQSYRDTDDVLMVGEDDTDALIAEMIAAACAPFRSRRIHIGMDEAYWLGRGNHWDKYGAQSHAQLMKTHLTRVHAILKAQGLQAMMWSDMHFTAANPGGGIYHPDTVLTQEVLTGAPDDIGLVFWDYYHETQSAYDNMLQKHAAFSAETIYAGGIWTWIGPAVDYRKTTAAALPALEQCRKHGIRQVFATAWLDDGAECNLITILYGLQLFAEYCYTQHWDDTALAARFHTTCHADANLFLDIAQFNELPHMEIQPQSTANPCKMLLYEDPLIPMFEADFGALAQADYYKALAQKFTAHLENNPEYTVLAQSYVALAQVLVLKCQWRDAAAEVVRQKNRQKAAELCTLADSCAAGVEALRIAWRNLWLSTNKPEGWEVLDLRLGGLCARFQSANARMDEFARGIMDDIPELSCVKLPVLRDDEGRMGCFNIWSSYVSASCVGKNVARPHL
ncbi:MAG: family 20 glycosylhydrolase [Ruthenibacterium sp.]